MSGSISPARYTHDPYAKSVLSMSYADAMDEMGEPHPSGLSDSETESPSTLPHPHFVDAQVEEGMVPCEGGSQYFDALGTVVPFYAYDAAEARQQRNLEGCARVFIGQLPYHLTPSNVAWLMSFLAQREVYTVEKIVKWTENKKATGCFHLYCRDEDAQAFLNVNQTVLCEAECVWVARTPEHLSVLRDHCELLKNHPEMRCPFMPHQMMTVQMASSSYQRSNKVRARRPRMPMHRDQPAQFSGVNPYHSYPAQYSFPIHTSTF